MGYYRFQIEGGRVLVRPEDLRIKPFRDIYDADDTKYKEESSGILSFIDHFCDLNFALADLPPQERMIRCKIYAFGDPNYEFPKKYVELVKAGCQAYDTLNKTHEKRSLRMYDDKINALMAELEETEVILKDVYEEKTDEEGRPKKVLIKKANNEEIDDAMKQLNGWIKARSEMEKLIMTSGSVQKNRANVEESLLEGGLLGIQPNKGVKEGGDYAP